jgi:hypothetical protein
LDDRPSQGKYGRHFSPQSPPRAIKPLISEESQPSVQFSPVFLFNLKPVLTASEDSTTQVVLLVLYQPPSDGTENVEPPHSSVENMAQ